MDLQQSEEVAVYWTTAQRTVGAFIATLLPDFHEAEEVLQRVAVTLVRKFDQYDHQQSFVAWAIGIAKYEVLYYRRQRATDRHVFDGELLERIAQGYQRLAEESDPMRQALHECLQEVRGRARRALELRYGENLRSDSLARALGVTRGASRMLLLRVRAAIRGCVERRLGASVRTT